MNKNTDHIVWIEHKRQVREYGDLWSGLQLDGTIELRKCFQKPGGFFAQALIVVTDGSSEPEVVISMNGKIAMTLRETSIMHSAIVDAWVALKQPVDQV